MSSLRDSRSEIRSSPAPEGSSIDKWSDDEPLGRLFMSKRRNHSKSPARTSKSPKPKKSPTRTSRFPKPKISLTRLSPIVSSDEVVHEGTTTNFTLTDLNRMASLYPWPKGVTLCLPAENGGSMAKYPDSLVVHEEAFKAGFRLPVPTFVRDFLRWTELCPAQLSPNSWRYLSAYGIRCWEMNKEPTFLGMQYLFEMREMGGVFFFGSRKLDIVTIPTGIPGWKNRWFLVKKGHGYDFDFPIHPGVGVKFSKGPDEMKDIPVEVQELRDAFLSLEGTNPHHSQLVTHENLENAGLSLPHPRQSMKPGLSLIKSAIRKKKGLNSSKSVGASKKRTLGSLYPLGKEEERPTKKRFNSDKLHNDERVEVITPVQPTPKSPIHQLGIATDSPHSPEGRPNYLASSLTLEEANGLLKRATVNVDAVSVLTRLSDEQASAELARAVALQVHHANNLIEKHKKLLSSHLGSQAKLEELEEENEELKRELLCAKESAKQNEEMKRQIQSLEENLKKTQQEKAEQRQKIMELEMDLSKAKDKGNEENMKKQIQSLEDNLKKTQEENAEQHQKIMELKMDLSKAKDMEEKEFLISKQNEESATMQILSLEDNLKKILMEIVEQHQTIMELKMDLSKAKNMGKEEFLNSKGFYRRVAHFNDTYYMSGMRVGVCQAVKKYQHLDPKIVEFEPNFDDDCGYEVPDPPPYSSPIRLVPYHLM